MPERHPADPASPVPYVPRTAGLFHAVVRDHLETFLDRRREETGYGLPNHVERTFREGLTCGILALGFARVRCPDCAFERLVAFSCKGRLCPSCNARRMHDTAAHLLDRVLPPAPYRQWVLSLPRRIRYLLVTRPQLVSPVLRAFVQAVFAWQRRRARRLGAIEPLCGAVTFVQRFGDAVNLNLHFHVVVPDAVFVREGAGLRRLEQDPPDPADIARLTARLAKRIPERLAALGALEPEPDDTDDPERLACAAALVEGLGAAPAPDGEPKRAAALSAFVDGYSLHAGVAMEASDRDGLERLCRYGLRPPFSEERLEQLDDGRLLYHLRFPRPDGRTVLLMEPVELLRRLAVLVPPPGFNLVRYHGVFAPASKWRRVLAEEAALAAVGRGAVPGPQDACCRHEAGAPATPGPRRGAPPHGESARGGGAPPDPAASGLALTAAAPAPDLGVDVRPRRLDWAALLQRVFSIDVLHCERCGGRLQVIAFLTETDPIQRILDHLGLPTDVPRPRQARPAQGDLWETGPPDDDLLIDPPAPEP